MREKGRRVSHFAPEPAWGDSPESTTINPGRLPGLTRPIGRGARRCSLGSARLSALTRALTLGFARRVDATVAPWPCSLAMLPGVPWRAWLLHVGPPNLLAGLRLCPVRWSGPSIEARLHHGVCHGQTTAEGTEGTLPCSSHACQSPAGHYSSFS